MKINDLTAKIRTVLGDEEVAKITTTLKDIEDGVSKLSYDLKEANDDLHRVNHESKTRKETLREKDELIETQKEEIETLKTKVDDPAVKKELESLRANEATRLKAQRVTWVSEIDKLKDHADYEKLKGKFTIEEKWEDVSDEIIGANMSKLTEYQELGFFADPKGANQQRAGGDRKETKDEFDKFNN
jgi:chromosome segregation ATPase